MSTQQIPLDNQNEKDYITGGAMQQKQWQPTADDIQRIARICHEANRAVCVTNGDLSQPDWESAPDWQKASALAGVQFHIDTPYANAQRSHDQWLETKLRDGWRYGATKNPETKEHPCLLPYHALPQGEKVKDDIFRGIVHAYLEALKREQFA